MAAGVIFAFFAAGYSAVLRHLPIPTEILRQSQEEVAKDATLEAVIGNHGYGVCCHWPSCGVWGQPFLKLATMVQTGATAK